jgi:hypothetical protein
MKNKPQTAYTIALATLALSLTVIAGVMVGELYAPAERAGTVLAAWAIYVAVRWDPPTAMLDADDQAVLDQHAMAGSWPAVARVAIDRLTIGATVVGLWWVAL